MKFLGRTVFVQMFNKPFNFVKGALKHHKIPDLRNLKDWLTLGKWVPNMSRLKIVWACKTANSGSTRLYAVISTPDRTSMKAQVSRVACRQDPPYLCTSMDTLTQMDVRFRYAYYNVQPGPSLGKNSPLHAIKQSNTCKLHKCVRPQFMSFEWGLSRGRFVLIWSFYLIASLFVFQLR